MTRRKIGQTAALALAALCFVWCVWASRSTSIPELRVYDGYLMLVGAAVVVGIAAPLVWRWPRERSLIAIALAATLGCVIPLILSALRHHIPLAARLGIGVDVHAEPHDLALACANMRVIRRAGRGVR